jgi:hypothetical protein
MALGERQEKPLDRGRLLSLQGTLPIFIAQLPPMHSSPLSGKPDADAAGNNQHRSG